MVRTLIRAHTLLTQSPGGAPLQRSAATRLSYGR
jgi:hypothetical protein